MTNHKSFDDFLDELNTIESPSQKRAKIDERLKKLDEEKKEDEDAQKIGVPRENQVNFFSFTF